MKQARHRLWLVGLCAALLLGASIGALAQAYPARPVRMIIPFSAGGATDVPGRIMAQKLSDTLGQQVVVDNRPGAGSTIGSDIVAKANPDGYTLLMTATPFIISSNLYKKLPFDPLKDFIPVTQFGSAPNVLVIHPSLPAKSVKELIALARAQPGKIDYASSGNGSAQHLFGALFLSLAGINMTHIPYKGSGPATADLLGGQVKVGFPGIAIVIPHHKAGKVKILAQTTKTRAPTLPDVPTYEEAGYPGLVLDQWLGVFLPAGSPRESVTRLNAEIGIALKDSGVLARFEKAAMEPVGGSAEQFAQLMRGDFEKYGRLVKELNIKVD